MLSSSQIKESLYESLKKIGASDQEIDLYVLSLKLGPSSISKIAQYIKISRPNIYKLIIGLEEKGLAEFSKKKKYKRDFVVLPPSVLVEILNKEEEVIKNSKRNIIATLPELLEIFNQGEIPTKIKVFQGTEQYVELYEIMKREVKDKTEFFGSAEDFVGFVSWSVNKDWINYRIKNNILVRALVLPGSASDELLHNDKNELRETKILKSKTIFPTSFQIFSNKIIFWQPKAPLAVLIEDQYIVQMMKMMFNSLWALD